MGVCASPRDGGVRLPRDGGVHVCAVGARLVRWVWLAMLANKMSYDAITSNANQSTRETREMALSPPFPSFSLPLRQPTSRRSSSTASPVERGQRFPPGPPLTPPRAR